MRRIRKVLEVGCGIGAQKAIAMAIDHPDREIHGVDREPGSQHERLLQLLRRENLRNLKVTKGKSAVTYLRELWEKEKTPIYDHAYAHWVLSTMSRQVRLGLFKELIKNIKPGAKWSIIDEGFIEEQIADELREAGFKVSARRITLNELIKDPPLNIEQIAISNPLRLLRTGSGTIANYGLMDNFVKEFEELKRRHGEGAALKLIKRDKQILRQRLENYETEKPTGKDAEAIRRMVMHRGSDLQKPFVVITAAKPKK